MEKRDYKKEQEMENETDIRFQLDILRRDGYHAAARIIESMQGTVSRKAELEYLQEFVWQCCFDEELGRDQLRCLWTAYCLHHGLDADTSGYDNDLMELWNATAEDEAETADWSDYDSFDNFMCRFLV
ncbi:hypothetical protein [Faecalibaculum rodentium]|jgi:hypothetical protein|uniref:hypothetical protein n=1 Tax=Faecalibaculum rodentium TaxID=1702221 RepID=UPI0025ACB5C0|nr:hypothetical protein [Faecalibaculum rodentium]